MTGQSAVHSTMLPSETAADHLHPVIECRTLSPTTFSNCRQNSLSVARIRFSFFFFFNAVTHPALDMIVSMINFGGRKMSTTHDPFRYLISFLFIFVIWRANLEFRLNAQFTPAFGTIATARTSGFALDHARVNSSRL